MPRNAMAAFANAEQSMRSLQEWDYYKHRPSLFEIAGWRDRIEAHAAMAEVAKKSNEHAYHRLMAERYRTALSQVGT